VNFPHLPKPFRHRPLRTLVVTGDAFAIAFRYSGGVAEASYFCTDVKRLCPAQGFVIAFARDGEFAGDALRLECSDGFTPVFISFRRPTSHFRTTRFKHLPMVREPA
jgi:hypothetical protein